MLSSMVHHVFSSLTDKEGLTGLDLVRNTTVYMYPNMNSVQAAQ